MEGVNLEKEVKNSPQLPAVDSKESTPKSSKSNVKENQLESEIRQLKAQFPNITTRQSNFCNCSFLQRLIG